MLYEKVRRFIRGKKDSMDIGSGASQSGSGIKAESGRPHRRGQMKRAPGVQAGQRTGRPKEDVELRRRSDRKRAPQEMIGYRPHRKKSRVERALDVLGKQAERAAASIRERAGRARSAAAVRGKAQENMIGYRPRRRSLARRAIDTLSEQGERIAKQVKKSALLSRNAKRAESGVYRPSQRKGRMMRYLGALCGQMARLAAQVRDRIGRTVRTAAARARHGNADGRRPGQERRAGALFHRKQRMRFLSSSGIVLMGAVALFCAVRLISYGMDDYQARRVSAMLRQSYYEEMENEEAGEETIAPQTPAASPRPTPTAEQAKENAPAPAATPSDRLEIMRYPKNPNAKVSSRFSKLRHQNQDIIGWLKIEDLIDEAVVQRDNAYYLRRDYRGYHNVNGAIFLEETCDLRVRPYTMMLYGHNMKTGAMFGGLRNYENLTYYRNNPFVTFDTAYENGRYVIFAAAMVSLNPADENYLDIAKLNSAIIDCREKAIKTIQRCSVYRSSLEVTAQDQLLLLITCSNDDTQRRIIAARRVRENETESALAKIVQKTGKKGKR